MLLLQKQLNIFKAEKFQLLTIYSLAILLPVLLPKQQLLLGIAINSLLIYSITRYDLKKIFPILILPSLISYLNGLLFGSATIFLLYLVPFIALGNFALIYLYKKIQIKYVNVVIASSVKALILYSSVLVLMKLIDMPSLFLIPMGITQLVTALIGSTIVTLFLTKKSKSLHADI